MVEISALGIDPELRDGGVWFTPAPRSPEFQVKIRSTHSTIAKKAARAIDDPELILGFRDDPKNPEARVKAADALCQVYIVDWRGIEDGGEPIPWSSAVGAQWFSREDWIPMLLDTMSAVSDHSRFSKRIRDDAGN